MFEVTDLDRITAQTLGDEPYLLLIDGTWSQSASGAQFGVYNPATGQLLTHVPDAGSAETQAAIEAAYAALPKWSGLPAPERAVILRKVAALLMERRERLATLMTLEQGKPLQEARNEIAFAASFFTWFAGEAERLYGQIVPASVANKRLLVWRQAVGVAALITPWNFPTGMLARKLSAALAAGCTAICKPAEQTPLSAIALGHILVEAGVPNGVVNIITCHDPVPFSEAIFADDRVRKISFTGSTEVGKLLIGKSAAGVKRLSLELGGNAPFIVFEDADLQAAVQGAILSKFRNAGQTCVCANRIFVQRSIYETFAEQLTEAVRKLRVGNGLAPDVQIGPLIDQAARQKVERHVQDALAQGAQVRVGGSALAENSLFWQPTVITGAQASMLVAREETFGPVAPLIAFEHEDEAIQRANDTQYGLAAYFYTRDVSRVFRVAERLEYGIIGVNDPLPSTAQAPFGGIKQSGLGREGGATGIDEYLDVKYIALGI
jgi:succinate-semialdehyde dehydrogenase/glutarate-semialdehyde dehydrogenase